MVLFDDWLDSRGTRATWSFRKVEVVLWGWWETGEQELQGPSNADVDEEPQSHFIRDEESCFLHEPPAWTPFEPRVGRYDHWLWPWEWSEETGECYAYD